MRNYIFLLISIIFLFCVHTTVSTMNETITYYQFDSELNDSKNKDSIVLPYKSNFNEHNIKPALTLYGASIIFFTFLTDYQNVHQRLMKIKKHLFINSLQSIDLLASKSIMYSILKSNNHFDMVLKYTPNTFTLSNKSEIKTFFDNYDDTKIYILKSNYQRQKGFIISNNIDEIKENIGSFVVAQELLQNPYTINGHKINIRQYLLIIVDKMQYRTYLYEDGIMYYTPEKFIKNSLAHEHNITSGYIDRSIYESNPLTYQTFMRSLDVDNKKQLCKNMNSLFNFISVSFEKVVLKHDTNQHTNFVILGCDVAIDTNLQCKIMEMNKGPDLSYKDTEDSVIKYELIKNTLGLLNIINHVPENYIRLK